MAADLSNGQKVETVEGQDITVTIDGDTVMLNDTATVVQPTSRRRTAPFT